MDYSARQLRTFQEPPNSARLHGTQFWNYALNWMPFLLISHTTLTEDTHM